MSAPVEQPTRRFLVSWRTLDRTILPLGELACDEEVYRYRYLPDALAHPEFRALPNFPDPVQQYHSPYLFPFFRARIMDRRRVDFPAWCEALGLPPAADDLDLLARSGGWRQADRAAVTERPAISADGTTASAFLVRGVRHRMTEAATRDAVLAGLVPGMELMLRPDENNEVNAEALVVTTAAGAGVGWVPDALVPYVGTVCAAGGRLRVLRCNGPEWPPYLRLLVEVCGRVEPTFDPLPMLSTPTGAVVA